MFQYLMIKKRIDIIVAELKKIRSIQAIYLFGSQVRGEAGPLSDIDICVIAPAASKKEKNEISGCAYHDVDIILFDNLPLTIQARIFKEGKLLFVANQHYIDELAWRTTKTYLDYKPILKKFIETYLPGVHYV